MPLRALASILAMALAAACTSSDAAPTPPLATPEAAPTFEATATATATPRPVRTPIVTPTPTPPPGPPRVEISPTVWLIDVASGEQITLLEDDELLIGSAWFDDEGRPVVRQWPDGSSLETTFDLAGKELSRGAPAPYRCAQDGDRVEIDGRTFEGIPCGLVSPDGRWMLYGVDAGTTSITETSEVPIWDQWLLNLETDERTLLHAGMRHCGGCDGRFGPAWSPSGRFVHFAELVSGGDVFLTDTASFETGVIASGPSATDLSRQPVWSPTKDQLLRAGTDGATILEDLALGETIDFPGPTCPAAFDPSGRYLYFPALELREDSSTDVTVIDVNTLEAVAVRPGVVPSDRIWGAGGPPIVGVQGGIGFAAALEDTPNCRGTIVYSAEATNEEGLCVPGGRGAVFSPDASQVAIAVERELVRASYLGGQYGGTMWLTDIVIVDVTSGEVRTVAEGAVSDGPPAITWNEAGTHILVRWPASYGI